MRSTASYVVPGSYAPVMYKAPPNNCPFQVESACSGARHSPHDLIIRMGGRDRTEDSQEFHFRPLIPQGDREEGDGGLGES